MNVTTLPSIGRESAERMHRVEQAPPPRRPSTALIIATIGICLAIIAIGAESAYMFEASKPDVFAARAEVHHRGVAWVESEIVALQSRSRVAPIAAPASVDIEEFDRNYSASIVPGTQVIRIEYASEDADAALSIVSRITSDYIAERTATALDATDLTLLDSELAGLRTDLTLAETELFELGPTPINRNASPEHIVAQDRVLSIRDQVSELEVKRVDAELFLANQDTQVPELFTTPFVLDNPVEPRPLRRAALGGIAGATIAAGVAFLILRRRSP